LKVLIHDLVMGLPPKVSTTTSNMIIGVTALAGTSVYLRAGLIEPGLAAPVVVGITIGAFLGTRVLVRLANATVRRFFLAVLLLRGGEMIGRGLRGCRPGRRARSPAPTCTWIGSSGGSSSRASSAASC